MNSFMSKWGAVVWVCWLAAFIISFGIFETWALMTKGLSLSMFTWHVSENWPPIIYLLGMLSGGLAVHFWWHWAPPTIGQLGGTGG